MFPAFDNLHSTLKQLPGLGSRSAERICIHLLAERPEKLNQLMAALQEAAQEVGRCPVCGNLCQGDSCAICADLDRDDSRLCIVESVNDLIAIEKSGAWKGRYHVIHGKISPLKSIGPESLNLESLKSRLHGSDIREVLLALANDIESEATCHYIQEVILADKPIAVSRIGFGLPSGGDITYADALTLRNALESRKSFG
ncbi:MAG: Recombination protein RecR [Verrucomicrobia bacterium ADurb.Bin474]|nr:MAG: Recombination protein RecR [Verrucomicrobia bacterium ADurb.Bin474]